MTVKRNSGRRVPTFKRFHDDDDDDITPRPHSSEDMSVHLLKGESARRPEIDHVHTTSPPLSSTDIQFESSRSVSSNVRRRSIKSPPRSPQDSQFNSRKSVSSNARGKTMHERWARLQKGSSWGQTAGHGWHENTQMHLRADWMAWRLCSSQYANSRGLSIPSDESSQYTALQSPISQPLESCWTPYLTTDIRCAERETGILHTSNPSDAIGHFSLVCCDVILNTIPLKWLWYACN